MHHQHSPAQVAVTLEHLYRHWEEKRKAEERLPSRASHFTIALSREVGTPGTAVGHEVGARLGWTVYGHELLVRIAQDMAVHAKLVESVDERRVGWLKQALEQFFNVPAVSEFAYSHRLVKTVLALGSHGECVIVGRGSPFILPAETTLRVRLVAPLEERIAAIRKKHGSSHQEAKRQLEALEFERNSFVQNHFLKNAADPDHYDLVVNSSRFGVGGCAELIIAALGRAQTGRRGASQGDD
jgi:cytidylate kinase